MASNTHPIALSISTKTTTPNFSSNIPHQSELASKVPQSPSRTHNHFHNEHPPTVSPRTPLIRSPSSGHYAAACAESQARGLGSPVTNVGGHHAYKMTPHNFSHNHHHQSNEKEKENDQKGMQSPHATTTSPIPYMNFSGDNATTNHDSSQASFASLTGQSERPWSPKPGQLNRGQSWNEQDMKHAFQGRLLSPGTAGVDVGYTSGTG
ncbi:hypothetical protein MMC09_003550 [Bachmanniomyces sp. S44760]|nr:hypothetical protein [Bachmanniomyces sp. S44760]